MNPPGKNVKPAIKKPSSRTKVRGFRITHTHDMLLNSATIKSKSSAIIRVLLTLYFNKRIPNIDALIEAELDLVENIKEQQLAKFRTTLQEQKAQKEQERALKNGNNTGRI